MSALLRVENLSVAFSSEDGLRPAVREISFELNQGETLGIVGESGSGKSVTSLSVMRLLPANGKVTSGRILFSGKDDKEADLLSLDPEAMRLRRGKELAMIFQEPMTSLNPVLSCGFQVAEALRLHKGLTKQEARLKAIELFGQVKLPNPERVYDAYPHEISGGQKQRVMIAMAISCDPSVLIADEPTTALDVTVQKTILQLLRTLQQERNMGMVFITHDLGVIAEIADRVVVMYKGAVVEQGSVKDIFRSPRHPYTKSLLACRPPLDRRLRRLPVVSDFLQETAEGIFSEQPSVLTEKILTEAVSKEERKTAHGSLYSQSPVLEVKGLCTWFPVRKGLFGKVSEYIRAVDDVSFNVYPGETLGLVGESGCGKTTLGRTILRLTEPTAGQVRFMGKDFAALRGRELRSVRKDIQIVFQDPYSSLNPRMTIGEAILEPMKVHGLFGSDKFRKEKVIELLERVSIRADQFNRYPHEFSGGQRQRICIARALALQPKFVICDESVSALDVSVQAQVLNLLNELKKEFGLTYIFISHDLSVVKYMSDRMIVMNKGKIEEEGDPDVIYSDPRSSYTKALIEAIPASRPKALNG
ncbi:MAG: transporter, ATP-binding protein [Bacteroidota bacterium]